MNPKEQEIAIGELEEKVDRLRNLYEQYFLGFEKLEPAVPKKDVERRFAILRKEQIRNTAMRFRFQVVTQKYNTYAMHWVRICRQIEEGTYKRHIRKAKARFGDGARADNEREISIDIDMDDFESADFDSVLAEATAAAEAFDKREASDTVPPPMSSPGLDRAELARQMLLKTPGTSFAIAGRREIVDDIEPHTPPPSIRGPSGERIARSAPLPAGSKPRIVRKRDDTEPPASVRTLSGGPPSQPRVAAPPASSARLPAPSSPDFEQAPPPFARPVGPRIVRSAPASVPGAPGSPPGAPSTGRLPAATPSAGAQASGRIPAAAPSGPASANRLPAAPPAAASSAGRIPAAAPPPGSTGRLPAAAPPSTAAGKASGGMPAARPPGAPAAPGAPGAPARAGAPASVGGPAVRPPPPPLPPGSKPGMPIARPGAPSGSSPRAPMSSVPDRETAPPSAESRPSVRPRAPLPLPSQVAQKKKEEE